MPSPAAAVGGAGSFVLRAARPAGAELGRWPRAGVGELLEGLAEAREALERAERDGFGAWGPGLPDALLRLPAGEARDEGFAAVLGLGAEEALIHQPGSPRSRRRWSDVGSRPLAQHPAIVLLRSHWSLLHAGFRQRALAHLSRRSAVVVIDDGRLPMVARQLARELDAVGLPSGAYLALHDDGPDLLSVALEQGGFDVLHAIGQAEEQPVLARRIRARLLPTGVREPFGLGVLEGGGPELLFEALARAEWDMGPEQDPAERAEAAALAAFGRVESLSGQLPGRLGWVRVAGRQLSEFTRALLAALEGDPAFGDPVPAVESGLLAALDEARQLGLDEGATLIHEGPPGSRSGGRDATLVRLVFTNVEPGMRLAALQRPMPLLLLSRARGPEPGPRGFPPPGGQATD